MTWAPPRTSARLISGYRKPSWQIAIPNVTPAAVKTRRPCPGTYHRSSPGSICVFACSPSRRPSAPNTTDTISRPAAVGRSAPTMVTTPARRAASPTIAKRVLDGGGRHVGHVPRLVAMPRKAGLRQADDSRAKPSGLLDRRDGRRHRFVERRRQRRRCDGDPDERWAGHGTRRRYGGGSLTTCMMQDVLGGRSVEVDVHVATRIDDRLDAGDGGDAGRLIDDERRKVPEAIDPVLRDAHRGSVQRRAGALDGRPHQPAVSARATAATLDRCRRRRARPPSSAPATWAW